MSATTYTAPKNFQQKCLCVLLLDVSGSMRKPVSDGSTERRIDKLNEAIASFYDDVVNAKNGVSKQTKGMLEVAIVAFDQEPKLIRPPKLLSREDEPPVLQERGSTTETVAALDYVINDIIAEQKKFYAETGQKYYRPWIVLITDGNPTSSEESIERISKLITKKVNDRKFTIIGIGVGDKVSMSGLKRITANRALPLKDMRFAAFFSWLSNSLSNIAKSTEDDTVDLTENMEFWTHYKP